MDLLQTLLFYLVIGAGVSVAIAIGDHGKWTFERTFRAFCSLLFWPLFFPMLLARKEESPGSSSDDEDSGDDLSQTISTVRRELDSALNSMENWSDHTLEGEKERINELVTAWETLAQRIRAMDRVLARDDGDANDRGGLFTSGELAENDRVQRSVEARRLHLDYLSAVRKQTYADLIGTLASVRELVTMIHLARFTGEPASRAQELVEQIAAVVEGLSEVTRWSDNSATEPCRPEQTSV